MASFCRVSRMVDENRWTPESALYVGDPRETIPRIPTHQGMPKRKPQSFASGVTAYTDPRTPGALRGVARYAKAQGLTLDKARQELQGELAYTLHWPVCWGFKTSPVLVFHKDDQWQADLVEMQPLKKWNGGN